MTPSIMLQGTASDVGKSVLVAGLCRILAQDGYRCTPFKSQNMALNSGITPDGKEMGRAQIFQAEAAGILPDVRMNPVLLKPTSDRRSQVVLMGEVACTMDAVAYHAYKPQLHARILAVYRSLAQEHDVVVLEGAGSPAEINLRDRDIVNMGMAAMAQSPVVLVADIDRGGVFAAIYGTLALLLPEEKARVKGVIINKFRGDVALLQSGISQIEALTGVPVLGVLPWLDLQLEDEDGVALHSDKYRPMPARALDIAVVRLPHIANFSDFTPLMAQPDVRVRYITQPEALQAADLVILPGSKNTLDDLHWLQLQGMAASLLAYHHQGGAVLGICGGYQMLGEHIVDGVESDHAEMAGLGLLPVVTRFAPRKVTTQVCGQSVSTLPGLWSACASLPLRGYEIHMGTSHLQPGAGAFAYLSERTGQVRDSSNVDGAVSADGSVLGTYLHDLFTNSAFTRALLDSLRQRKGLSPFAGETVDYATHKSQQFDRLAAAMREHLDMDAIYRIIGLGAVTEP